MTTLMPKPITISCAVTSPFTSSSHQDVTILSMITDGLGRMKSGTLNNQQHSSQSRNIVNSGPVLGIFLAIFLLWELCCWLFKVPDFILPSPSVIIDKIVTSWWLLLVNGLVTAQEIVIGFGMSVVIGIPLAVLVVYSRVFERVAFPFMVSLQTIPKVALAPILVMWSVMAFCRR